jgi:hypothetical protein
MEHSGGTGADWRNYCHNNTFSAQLSFQILKALRETETFQKIHTRRSCAMSPEPENNYSVQDLLFVVTHADNGEEIGEAYITQCTDLVENGRRTRDTLLLKYTPAEGTLSSPLLSQFQVIFRNFETDFAAIEKTMAQVREAIQQRDR